MRKLLFFHAPWCAPCRFYERHFITPIERIAGVGAVQRIDVQAEPFLADRYGIDKLPAIVLLDGEKVCMNRTGAVDIRETAGWLNGGGAG